MSGTTEHAGEWMGWIGLPLSPECRAYWGTHGCDLPRGHDGPHVCLSCLDPVDREGYVGAPPYYGPGTRFFGEDA